MDSGMDEYMDAFVWIYMGRCMDLDGLHGFALRLDNDSKSATSHRKGVWKCVEIYIYYYTG